MTNVDLSPYQSDHLILLVGGNPLPNAVAGLLLTSNGGSISLIYSAQIASVAQRLQTWFKDRGLSLPQLYQADETKADKITFRVRQALNQKIVQTVGVNYTGGTKAMAVHAYRTAEMWANENHAQRPTFSYLDARTLHMVFDAPSPESGESSTKLYVGRAVKIDVQDLIKLHGWTLQHDPVTTAVLSQTARLLAQIFSDDESRQVWQAWIKEDLESKCRRPDRPDKWKNKTELMQQQLCWPEAISPLLQEVTAILQQELNLSGETLSVADGAAACGYKNPEDFCSWLHGKWLEHDVLNSLSYIATDLYLHQVCQNIEPREVQFDVDVIAMRGYQLFAISCSTDDTKRLLKSKLFEAYIRARQIGGDETRVALVCGSAEPELLEREMRRDIDPDGRIRVFGRAQLPNLADELAYWIESQSQET